MIRKLNRLHERFLKEAFVQKNDISLPSGYDWKAWKKHPNNKGSMIIATAEASKGEKTNLGKVTRRLNFDFYYDTAGNFEYGAVGGGLVSAGGLTWTTRDLKITPENASQRAKEVDDKITAYVKSWKLSALHERFTKEATPSELKAFYDKFNRVHKAYARDIDASNKKWGIDPEESDPDIPPGAERDMDAAMKKHFGPMKAEYQALVKKYGKDRDELKAFEMEVTDGTGRWMI